MTRDYLTIVSPAGARAVLVPDQEQPLVAVSLRLSTGSRDDPDGSSGVAHVLEHLMFSGTSRIRRGEHAKLIQSLGGFLNAKTSADWTKYFHVVTPELLDEVLSLEIERFAETPMTMTAADLDVEREIVLNERVQRMENVAYGTALEQLAARLFPAGSPYHRLPAGTVADLRRITIADCRRFHEENYVAARVHLAVVGDFDPGLVEDKVRQLMAVFAARAVDRPVPPEAPLPPTRRILVPSPFRPKVCLGYRMPDARSPDFEPIQIAALFLGRGLSARLSERLVRHAGLASAVAVKVVARADHHSIGIIELVPIAGVAPERVIAALDATLVELIDAGLDERDVGSAVAKYRSEWLTYDDSLLGRSDALSLTLQLFGSIEPYLEHDARIGKVTLDDLRRGVQGWYQPDRRVELVYT